MEHRIGATPHALDPHGATGGMEERQLLRGALAHILVRITPRLTARVPVVPRIGDRLVGTRLVFRPDGEPVLRVGRLDQVFFAPASGSVTRTVPLLRLRTTVPV